VKLQSSDVERLDAAQADLEPSATAADEERTTLAEEKEKLTAASTVVEANIGELETQLKRELKGLPEPLIEKIKPLSRRLPKDPAKTELSLGERVQNIVGILSQATNSTPP
jgi:predicted  nucleic acid-binding Zn-ribbon protein